MSTKLPWTRLFADKWLLDLAHLPPFEGFIYVKLRFQMLRTGEPLTNNFRVLSLLAGCTIKRFQKALDLLLETGHIICLEDGRLWSLQVEEELNNSNENLNKFSERAKKAAEVRWEKYHNSKHDAKDVKHSVKHDACDMLNDAINNNNNIYKKNNTKVLLKKEIDFEDLKTEDHDHELTEDHDVENHSDQIELVTENQPPIHEQENVSKKAKRSKSNRGCRLPDDFEPDYDFAIAEGLPPERVKVEMAKFRDYWKAKAGKDATKVDWQATWRYWVRNSKSYKVNQIGGNYGNHSQKQKSIGERIADSILDIESRGHFEAHSRDGSGGVSFGFEGWQSVNETAGSDCLRCL